MSFQLLLAGHQIEFNAVSKALFGALVLGKVMVILDKLPFMNLFGGQPAWIAIAFRTCVHLIGVSVVISCEKIVHLYREIGTWSAATTEFFATRDARHVLAQVILVGGLIAAFCALEEVRRELGPGRLRSLFLSRRPGPRTDESE